jgi:predicted amidohydrolase
MNAAQRQRDRESLPPATDATDAPSGAMTGGRLVRAIAVGNRISVSAAASEASYIAELERIVGLAAPHFAPDRPTLLTLTELLGLPAALVGGRGALARRARRAQTALGLLAVAYAPRILRIRRRWPGVSLARALLLARADALFRPLAETLARLAAANRAHIVATTLAPRLRHSTDPREIAAWGRVGAPAVYVPTGPEVYNAALVFGPDGALLGRVEKVYLTSSEIAMLDLTPGKLEDVRVITTEVGRLGVAISLDAFTPAYLQRLAEQGAEIVVQPDANDQPWAAPSATSNWQPDEWLGSVLGAIQPRYPSVRYNVCAMQTGNFFDIVFDGQSSISSRDAPTPADGRPDQTQTLVGVAEHRHTATGEALVGGFVALAPWVAPDPAVADLTLTLADRRARLMARGRALAPGGAHANEYRESVIWADLRLES